MLSTFSHFPLAAKSAETEIATTNQANNNSNNRQRMFATRQTKIILNEDLERLNAKVVFVS